jgi:hypothetical protein
VTQRNPTQATAASRTAGVGAAPQATAAQPDAGDGSASRRQPTAGKPRVRR